MDLGNFAASLGVEVASGSAESARLELPFRAENANPGGALHGGVPASMVNLGGLVVAAAALGEEAAPLHTCSVQINYLAAAINEAIAAEARLLRRGRELCFVDVAVAADSGKPVARGLATVRGRFGAAPSTALRAQGDDGASDPGVMGPAVPKRSPFIGRLGMSIEHMQAGRSRIAMPYLESNAEAGGGVAEGPILALADTTGAMAAWAETGPGPYKASTVGLQAQLLAPAGPEAITAYGRVAHRDREIFWTDVEVATSRGRRVVARGMVLYRIVVPGPASARP